MEQQKQLFFIGNPLLDISVECADDSLCKKYGIECGLASLAGEA